MAVENDQTRARPGDKKQRSHREIMRALWLPTSEAPANDNEQGLYWVVRAFVLRHLNWLLPTLALAALSYILLSLSR